ncbi:MAG: transketolase [Ignavibacteriae bacterium HGW-Ignavibacteriae-3]|nr:MAG: transketolase [Ignavibacteriae bacterium HGW-Ignavibacteriae-3]
MQGNNMKNDLTTLASNTIRILAAEGVQKANSGHPGMPMGMADVAAILYSEFLNHNPDDTKWANRDRFVLSAGHGSMLLYSLLHVSGYDVTMDDLKSFRQWGSRTPGHPEYGHLPGVETTTGPLGQGFANGIGMAIASKMTAARFSTDKFKILGNHFIYGIVSDGDLMEGISHEAASIAGHLKVGNIIYFYDDNSITIEGKTEITFSEDTAKRFESYGWQVLEISAYDHDGIRKAIKTAQSETEKPSIIITKSHIGYGSPHKVDTPEVHGSPLGKEELLETKKNLGFPVDKEFYIPQEVKDLFSKRKEVLAENYNNWKKEFDTWKKENSDRAKLYEKYMNNWLPDNLFEELIAAAGKDANATRSLSSKVIQKIAELVPNFVGGSADLAPSTNTYMKAFGAISTGNFEGRNFHFGIREHAMGSILNGIIVYGGFRAFGSTFLVFSDYMRPVIRLASLMKIPAIYVFTHDSIFVGEDGPTHEPIEHLAVLRAIPNVTVLRPDGPLETAAAWTYALQQKDGPVALILTRQKIDAIELSPDFNNQDLLKGGYIVSEGKNKKIDLIIAASGSEVPVAVAAQKILQDNLSVRVVSIMSKEIFGKQSDEYKNSIVPADVPVAVVEAASMTGWGDMFRSKFLPIGMTGFGASAPAQVLAEKFGFTGEQVAEKIKNWL